MVDERVNAALHRAGHTDIRPAHQIVFRLLGGGGARLVDLAARGLMTKQSMGYLVDHLEGAGYVERVSDPLDGRAKILQLTPLGRAAEGVARAAITELQNDWAREMGQGDFDLLIQLLRRLNAQLQTGDSR
ncbi:DNA-binding MarR family transcriptional regulator [Deinococcus metalli]|uniref:DNA-binding MarR family transcriptional regulator n=1 Tax=Deinococcus metalli TaxID=1141878 RepID=A0A7W8KE73_9DEIO|nr:MarR family winged helix-turn-helix transcriptional regulator [Deinococcus metalli]MBB5376540.1 DNA-binding MarR family transcriptional regulator [Deinococcus metalli]